MSRVAFLFPGQGSQYSGMGLALAEAYPESREVFDSADRALGKSLSDLCFVGPDEKLALTENTQPAILATSIAALRALEARGIRPSATAGHSLGEYSAHIAARTFDFEPAVSAVRDRGRFMQEAVPVGQGAMAAVIGLDGQAVQAICAEVAQDDVVVAANFNSPVQTVIAGDVDAVDRAIAAAGAAGAKRAVRLPVSAPFHCPRMQPAADRLVPVLEAIEFRDPEVPVYTNVDAAPVERGGEARAALVRQVAAPVQWQGLVEAMIADGIDTFVEVGPGRILGGLLRRIDRRVRSLSVSDPAGVDAVVEEWGKVS